jgi:hypothetical protein
LLIYFTVEVIYNSKLDRKDSQKQPSPLVEQKTVSEMTIEEEVGAVTVGPTREEEQCGWRSHAMAGWRARASLQR